MPLGSHYSITFEYVADGDPGYLITKFSHIMIKPDYPLERMNKTELMIFIKKLLDAFLPLPSRRKYQFTPFEGVSSILEEGQPIYIDVLNTLDEEETELGALYIKELKSYDRKFDFRISSTDGIPTRVRSKAVMYEADSVITDEIKSRR